MPTKEVLGNTTTRVLRMIFTVSGGATCTYNLADPKTDLTLSAVKALMEEMIEDEFGLYNGNELTDYKDAYIYETNTIALA